MIVAADMAKIFKFPVASDIMALIVCGTEAIACFSIFFDSHPGTTTSSDTVTLSHIYDTKTIKVAESYLLQNKYVLTQFEARFAGIIGMIVAADMAKIFKFPLASDIMALIHAAFIIIFIILCSILSFLHLLVGFNTLNEPVEIDRYKLKTQFFILILAVFHYINQHTTIVSITVSTTVDASPYKAAKVVIVVKKSFYRFSTYRSFSGIHSHPWTQEQLQNFRPNADNFDSSINFFNNQISNIINTRLSDQQIFDGKLQEIFDGVLERDNYPFLKDIFTAASIAFAKASSYCEDIPAYEYFLELTGFEKIRKPSIIFDVIAGGNNSICNSISIEPFGTLTFEAAIQCARKVIKKLQSASRNQITFTQKSSTSQTSTVPTLIHSLSTPVTPNGTVFFNFQTSALYFLELAKAIKRHSTFDLSAPKKQVLKVYLDSNASALWNGDRYRFDGNNVPHSELLENYLNWQKNYSLHYIRNPFIDKINVLQRYRDEKLKFVKGYGEDYSLSDCIGIVSLGLDDCMTITRFVQATDEIRQNQKDIIICGSLNNIDETILADIACAVRANKVK
uniref:Uncharacterized protein n=1 Tax=Panagrolaimus sp. ES5 TaxID=591445 RepID=A0AC34FKI0_9BILA